LSHLVLIAALDSIAVGLEPDLCGGFKRQRRILKICVVEYRRGVNPSMVEWKESAQPGPAARCL